MGFPINPPREPIVGANGLVSPSWYRFFVAIQNTLVGSGASSPFDDSALLAASPAVHPLIDDDALFPPPQVGSAARDDDLMAPYPGASFALQDGDKGDITVTGDEWTIDSDAVTYAKMQNVSATSRILGRKTALAGDPEECTLSEVLDFIGSAAQGDILYRGASAWARLGAGTAGYALTTGGVGANPAWYALDDDTYTPTLTGVTNVSASTPTTCFYTRIGSVAHVGGQLDVTATAVGDIRLGISLPIASNFSAARDCAGSGGVINAPYSTPVIILADTANDRAELRANFAVTTSRTVNFHFSYRII